MIVQEFNLNMIPDSEPVVVHVNQYDTEDGRFVIHLYNGDTPYTPTNATVLIEGCKPDGNVFAYGPSHGVSISGNTVTAPCLIQMTAVKGRTMTNLIVKENGASTGTFVFWLDVQETPLDRAILSETEIPAIVALAEEQAERSEAWAVGTKNGHPVSATDPTFDNNAKYWAEQAASSVTGVASFNGRSGSVLPMAGDYNSDMIPHTMSSSIQPIGGIQPGETVMSKRIINALTSEVEKKSDKTDLTSISITGTTNTTGATIATGTYFYLNGSLVRAKADIANGASFTLNTNYEVVTAGGLNDIYNRCSKKKYTGTTRAELATTVSYMSFEDLCHSVLVVNSGNILTFYDWSTARTRWMSFAYDTSTNALYHTTMVNSSVDGITTGTKTTSSYNTSTVAITSWALYY